MLIWIEVGRCVYAYRYIYYICADPWLAMSKKETLTRRPALWPYMLIWIEVAHIINSSSLSFCHWQLVHINSNCFHFHNPHSRNIHQHVSKWFQSPISQAMSLCLLLHLVINALETHMVLLGCSPLWPSGPSKIQLSHAFPTIWTS